LTKNKRLQSVRDLFLIGCYTALRYSDYSNIKPENIYTTDKGIFLNIKTYKTGKTVIIPLHWIVKNILDKYKNELPRSITNQKTNDYLKELGELAGINDKVNISQNKGGVRVDITKLKYKLITTHTARRSGATNMYLSGIPVQSIMILTGHKTEKVFMSYLRFTEEDNANILFDSPFFKPQSNLKVI
jgi:integrase